jgi:hypothetical protein
VSGQIVYKTLEEAITRMPEDMGMAVSQYELALFEGALTFAAEGLISRTPQREGTLIQSLAIDKQDSRYSVGYTDPKANSLDWGRRKSKPFIRQISAGAAKRGRRGRLLGEHGSATIVRTLGSKQPQARRGMTVSTGYSLKNHWVEIQTEAAQKVGGEPE